MNLVEITDRALSSFNNIKIFTVKNQQIYSKIISIKFFLG